MSGGVDSSVAAALLMEQGYDVVGATLKLFSNEDIGISDRSRPCCSLADVEDARKVANKLGFDHFVFSLGEDFERDVIRRFAEGYEKAETPNPCIDCNKYIKFDKMLNRALLLDCDYMATGHYARVDFDEETGRYLLKKAKDLTKDQSYVLYSLNQQQLSRMLFPLGEYTKVESRKIAEEKGLITAHKPDSQDICFVREGDYAGFLTNTLGVESRPGNFVDSKGNVLGQHDGLIHYTIGQRKGLGLSLGAPQFVIRKDLDSNTVVIGPEEELFSYSLTAKDVNLISIESLTAPMEVAVKTRYSQKETPGMIYPLDNNRIEIKFGEPQRAVTPGQAVVFYSGDVVVGGATIEK